MNKIEELIQKSFYANKEIKVDPKDGAEERWNHKAVSASKVVYDCETMNFAEFRGVGSFGYSNTHTHGSKQSMVIKANPDIEDVRPRPSSSIHIPLNKEDWSDYNRVSIWVYPQSVGFQNFYFHFSIIDETGSSLTHAPSLTPNTWNHVVFEIPLFKRDAVVKFIMGPLMMGCPPEAEPKIKVYFSNVVLEQVNPDYILGWELENRIAYSHTGYFTNQEKIALIGKTNEKMFSIVNEESIQVFEGGIQEEKTEYGLFYILDFSVLKQHGNFSIKIGNVSTPYFEVSDHPYDSSVWKSIHFLRMLRCGDDVEGVHSPCHLAHHTVHPAGRLVGDYGGWHDAGDVSQFEICTAEMAHALIDLGESYKTINPVLSTRLLEEARWGLNWLLKTHFGDGHRALAVHYSIWRKNILQNYEQLNPENKDYHKNATENGPFENFIASAALAAAARVFASTDQVFSNWCLRIAKKDFEFGLDGYRKGLYTVRWGKGPDAQIAGSLVLAASELYVVTKETQYIEVASEYAKVVIACQQREVPSWKKPIRGFFYEDASHQALLTYEHRGHEQSPIHGLVRLLEVVPNHPDAASWKECLELYAEYITQTASLIYPYGLLPAHVYIYKKLNMDRFTIPRSYGTDEEITEMFKNQINDGIELDKDIYLRRFPIAIQRRGFHATLLSKVKAVSAIAKVLRKEDLKQIVINQLEWIMGKNPFASSTMYGEGHNYHPLYVAFSRQIVGALPVGIETFEEQDKPFWPTVNNAVFKEVWGHTTGKFLWVLADILK